MSDYQNCQNIQLFFFIFICKYQTVDIIFANRNLFIINTIKKISFYV